MKYDIIAAGVGGQGVLSLARVISAAARRSGLKVVQSEVQGVPRGGTIMVHTRLSDEAVERPHIAKGEADLVLALEPLESLRYVEYLSPSGALITGDDPVRNIPDYPSLDDILLSILKLPRGFIVAATRLAAACGGTMLANAVLLGASTDFLPIDPLEVRKAVADVFSEKGIDVVEANLKAFEAGHAALSHREVVDEFETLASPVH